MRAKNNKKKNIMEEMVDTFWHSEYEKGSKVWIVSKFVLQSLSPIERMKISALFCKYRVRFVRYFSRFYR